MLNVRVEIRLSGMSFRLSGLLVFLFLVPLMLPLASASGMQGCTINGGTCDDWDKADDGTPNQQDWIVGVYEFDLIDTSTIDLEMTWALHEFNRSTIGLDGAILNAALAAEGMSAVDGAPADLIRNYFDQTTAGPGTPTVRDKLVMEVNDTIEELLESGFGTVDSISTGYVNSITNSGATTSCSDDPSLDTAAEAGLANNVFNPPICFSVSASVSLSTSTFNLGSVDPLTLERVYRGMLVMGADITSGFELFSEPGHSSEFVINPPDFATVKNVDSSGVQVIKSGPPSYMAASWVIDNLDAPLGGERISQQVSIEIGHRNSSQTSSVVVGPEDIGVTLKVILDLSDESSAWIDVVAGLHYLDAETLESWGVSLVDVSENASIPWVTSDGVRLGYHNDLIDLDNFTDNFPMELVGESIETSVPGNDPVVMSDPVWVSNSALIGLPWTNGGLNHSHADCPENLPVGFAANYCIEGAKAMDGTHPVYLRSSSQPFSLHLLDLLKQEVNDSSGVLDVIEEDDLRRLLDSGLSIEANLGKDLLQNMIPENLPPTEVTLEIILPLWMQAATGESSLVLIENSVGEDYLNISMAGPQAYDPRHSIFDEDDNEICTAHESDWSCVNFDIEMDIEDLDFNEWGPSIDVRAGFTATVDVYRIKVPNEVLDNLQTDNASIELEVIPSDLIRLGLDIAERMEEPPKKEFEFGDDYTAELEFTESGLKKFVSDLGLDLTEEIQADARRISEEPGQPQMDLSGFEVVISLENLGGIGTSVGDDVPITLRIEIPMLDIHLGAENGWGGISEGDPQVGLSTNFVRAPMMGAMQGFVEALTLATSNFIQVGGSGLTLDDNGEPVLMEIDPQNLTLNEETGTSLRGEFTLSLPSGITLKDFQTANGWEKVEMKDGRQVITISIDSLTEGDEFSFSLHVSWWYVFTQFWIYPTLLFSLIVWRVRARRQKKKKKLAAAAETKVVSVAKGGLSDSDFAALSAGYDPSVTADSSFDLYDDEIWDHP